jgi:hypothetical protein
VHPLAFSARIGVKNKLVVKEWINNSVDCMVYKPVCYFGFVDIPWFWIAYFERKITPMFIGLGGESFVKVKDIITKFKRESQYIRAFSLSFQKLFPGQKKIFD